tara:strand:- start:6563 stop:6766 length:204 start_codon:yes stop_codon:yes gene_type:complete
MEVVITPDHITMDLFQSPLTEKDLSYLMGLMMQDSSDQKGLYAKLEKMLERRNEITADLGMVYTETR